MSIITHNLLGDVLSISFFIAAIVIVYFKWALLYWDRRCVRTIPTQIPFGHIKDVAFQRLGMGSFFAWMYNELKKKNVKYYGGCYMFSKPVFLVLDPDLIKQVLVKDFDHFCDHGVFVDEELDPLTGNLFHLEGEKWRNIRAKLTPTFTSAKMKLMFHTVVDCTTQLKLILEKHSKYHQPLEIKDVMARYTTDTIGNCAFGIECNSLKDPNSEFRKYGKKAFDNTIYQLIKILLSVNAPWVLRLLNIPLTGRDVYHFFTNMVTETVSYREKNNIIRKDFMHLLIQLKNNVKVSDDAGTNSDVLINEDGSQNLTIAELTAQAFVFYLGGFETSSTTATFLLYELAINQKIQDQLREEINNVWKKHNGNLTYEAITEMFYMEKCINETLRKYPPLPILPRVCTKKYNIPNSPVVLEKGLLVVVPIHGLHNDPELFPHPEIFDPERFNDENKAKRHPFAWLPFGSGPRGCIGVRFGLMQIKVGLVALLQNYKFTINSRTKIPIQLDARRVILTIEGSLWVDIEEISG